MTILWIFLSVLLALIVGKWILLIFLSPIIMYDSVRKRKKASIVYENDIEVIKKGLKNDNLQKPNGNHNKGIKKIIGFFIDYLDGFERYILLKTGFIPSHHIRSLIYKKIFKVEMASGAIIYYGAEIRGPYNLKLERGAVVGDRCVLDARRGYIRIGKNVQLGNSVNLWTGSHDYNDPWFRSLPGKRGPIEIEDYVWIGPGVTVLHSVKIGKGAVVGAGSIITKDVEPYSVMAGIPAKKVGERNRDLRYDLSSSHIPFY